MVETVSLAPPSLLFDVTRVASLRKRLGHAATALKIIGFGSAIFLGFYLSDPLGLAFAVIVTLVTPGCASVVANQLRSGSTWAVALAAIWWVTWAAFQVRDVFSKPQEISGYSILYAAVVVGPLYFLARGLLAFAAYRAHRRHDRRLTDPLALNPYEEGLRIKKRPKLINKKSMAAYGLLTLSPLPYLLVWVSQLTHEVKVFPNPWRLTGYQTGSFAIALAMVVCGARIYRRARRAAMLPGSALMKKDARPIVLYLRSFRDDSRIKLRARATNGRILLERLVKIPFEEVVTDHLWGYGPVLAIGNPQTKHGLAPLGAARDYVNDSSWQQKATELMREAAMIVVIAGGTEGLAWEVDTIAELGLAPKLVLLLPPVGVRELEARWRSFASHATSAIVSLQIDFARARALIFPKGSAALVLGDKGNDWTYEAVLDEAALVMAKERGAVDATATSPHRASPAGQVRQALGRIASFLRSALGFGLVLAFLVVLLSVREARYTVSRPYAAPGEARDSFIAEMLQVCRKQNPKLSAEALARYCSCFANSLADVVTIGELDKIESDPSAFQVKAKSVASTCPEKTLGQ